jgi:DNA-binding XRE family transcriptional regulator
MEGKHLKLLRERARMTQVEMARLLDVSLRTLAKWESEETSISQVYAKACRDSFENFILTPLLRACAEKIFCEIPSEGVSIWLVRHTLVPLQYSPVILHSQQETLPTSLAPQQTFWEAILHENTFRYQCLCKTKSERDQCYRKGYCDKSRCYLNDRIHKSMTKYISQTIYPLYGGETLNLAGDDIAQARWKFSPRRFHTFYYDQLCHSLLHVPYHIPSITGPQPAALLSLENKLQKDEQKHWKVIPFPIGVSGVKAYTPEEEQKAKDLIKEIYENDLKEVMMAFDYLPIEELKMLEGEE